MDVKVRCGFPSLSAHLFSFFERLALSQSDRSLRKGFAARDSHVGLLLFLLGQQQAVVAAQEAEVAHRELVQQEVHDELHIFLVSVGVFPVDAVEGLGDLVEVVQGEGDRPIVRLETDGL